MMLETNSFRCIQEYRYFKYESLRRYTSFEADYKAMKKSFIYGKALDFDVLIERLKTLQDRFRAINDDPLGPPA